MNWIIIFVSSFSIYVLGSWLGAYDVTLMGSIYAGISGPIIYFLLNMRGYSISTYNLILCGMVGGVCINISERFLYATGPYRFNEARFLLISLGDYTLGLIIGVFSGYLHGVKSEGKEIWGFEKRIFEFSPKFKIVAIIILFIIGAIIGNKIQNNPQKMIDKVRHTIGMASLEIAAQVGSPRNEEDIKPLIKLCQKIIDKYPETKYAAEAYELMAIPFEWINQFDKSFEFLERAKKIYEKLGDKKGIEHIEFEIDYLKSHIRYIEREREYYERKQKR